MTEAAHAVPEASGRIQLPPGTTTARVFDCARQRLGELRAQEALWDHQVTHEDAAEGLLETGNFAEDNVSGFRLQLRFDQAQSSALMRMRGAGAYFVDQGVDGALQEFRAGFEACIGMGSAS